MSCNYFSFFVPSSFAHSSSFIINIFCFKKPHFSFVLRQYFFLTRNWSIVLYYWYSMITKHKNISIQKLNIWIFSIIVYIYFSICMVFPLFPWFCGYSKNQVLLTVKIVNHIPIQSFSAYMHFCFLCLLQLQ